MFTLQLELPIRSEYYLLMPLTLEQLTAEVMQLPVESRVLLADRLVESLDSAQFDEVQGLWTAEAIRRRDEVRSGQVKAIPGEQVLDEVRRLVGR
jgi:putative addiction module component (TIGR02574 family)